MAIAWWVWIILAGLLALAEMHAPGSYLVWIALGAAVTSAVHAAFDFSLEGQLFTFAAAAALACLGGSFIYRRLDRRRAAGGEAPLNQRHLAMVGARGTVCEAFHNGLGKVRVGDSVWLAAGRDLAEGTPVVVSGVRGTRLFVEARQPGPAGEPPRAAGAAS